MQYDKNSVSKPVLGLNKDVHPSEQPKETIRFALNAVKEDSTGNYNNYQSEPSNEECYTLPEGYKTIGSIYLEDGEKVIFATDNTTSKIILLDSSCNATELVSNTCLGFNTQYTITGEYRVREGCNRVIYYNDNNNPDRFLDLDDLDSFKNDSGQWDCNLMRLTPDVLIPQINIVSVNDSGGNLEVGSYAFAVELLDNNLNTIDYGIFTEYIPIYSDNISNSYDSIHGALPSSQFLSEVGGQDATNKSITLELNNLDTSFSFARVIVLYRSTATGEVETGYELQDFIPISSSSIEYTFSTIDNAISNDATKYKTVKQKYSSSNVMEQVQNRLVRAGTKENVRDYSGYQRFVNNIDVTWQHVTENPFDTSEEHNTKNPLSYQNGNTFLGDEVYALAIEFIHSDGQVSPAFHIPGRAANATDLEELTVGTDVSQLDVQHLGLSIGDTITRWEYENTSTGISSGDLGYFQTDTTYSEELDCNGFPIFGSLAGENIRHHRIPCRSDRPVYFDSNGNPVVSKIGLVFDDITYPDNDIVGHRFLMAKKNESDKTVIDNGIMSGYESIEYVDDPIDVDNNYVFRLDEVFSGTEINDSPVSISTPKVFVGDISNVDYIKFIGYMTTPDAGLNELEQIQENNISVNSQISNGLDNLNSLDAKYRGINTQKLLGPNSRFSGDFDRPIVNRSYSNNRLIAELTAGLNDSIPFFSYVFISLKNNVIPHRNLYQLQYEPITDILTLTDDQTTFRGKAFTNHFEYLNIHFAGTDQEGPFNLLTAPRIDSVYVKNLFVDSPINYELRVEGTDTNSFFTEDKGAFYVLEQVASYDGTDYNLRPAVSEQYYRLNNDYNTRYGGLLGIPLPFNFDYCDKCLNERPNRIIFSPKSFNEEISDFYRLNFIDDYIDLPYHRGAITGIKYKNNKLYVHTEQTTFILQPNPQFVNTDQNTAYLNTGDFLSIPPYEIMQTDLGYGGLQNKLATSNSEFGYLWVDTNTGKVLNLTNGIDNLSNKGMSQWFKEHSRFKLGDFIKKETGSKYEYFDSINDINGIGISAIYDQRFERVIINKKDYEVRSDKYRGTITDNTPVGQLGLGELYFNTDTNQFVTKNGNSLNQVNLTNSEFFYNAGWVISYSFKHQAFLSFHSYLTDILFNDETYFYSVKGNKIYKHLHKDVFGKYFDVQYPFIIEYVANDFATDIIKSIQYYGTFEKNGSKDSSINYSNLLAYNGNQSTGKLDLLLTDQHTNPYSNLTLNNNTKSIVVTDNNSKISNLWDYSVDNRVLSKELEDLQNEFNLNGYIDLVPTNIDFTKSSYDAGELRDKYLIIRLFYYPESSDTKVTHRISNTLELMSIR